jgi:hypothetical protein
MMMTDSEGPIPEDEGPIPEDVEFATKAKQMALDLDPCGRFHEVTETLPPRLPATRWFRVNYMSASGNLCHLIVVFSDDGNIVATYAGVSLFAGGS